MTGLRKRIVLTAVEVLVVTSLVTTVAEAQSKTAAGTPTFGTGVQVTMPPKPCAVGKMRAKMQPGEDPIAYSQSECTLNDCDALYKDVVEEPQSKMNQACREAGLGADCRTQIIKCMAEDVSSTGDTDWMRTLTQTMGQGANSLTGTSNFGSLGSSLKSTKGCSNLSDKDYFDKKDRLDRDLADANREAANLKNDAASDTEKLNDKVKDAQEKIEESKKDIAEQKQKIDKEKRETVGQIAQSQGQAAEDLSKLNEAEMKIRAEMAKDEQTFTTQLIQMREELAKATCMAQVGKLRKELDDNFVFQNKGTMGAGMQARKDALQAAWDSCHESFNQRRLDLADNRKMVMQQRNLALAEIANQRVGIDDRVKNVKAEVEDTVKSLENSSVEADKRLASQMQNAQNALTAANQTTQQKAQALRDKQNTLTTKISQINSDIAKLGPQPKPGAKGGWRDAQGSVLTYLQGELTFCKVDECKTKRKDICKGSRVSEKLIQRIKDDDVTDDDVDEFSKGRQK